MRLIAGALAALLLASPLTWAGDYFRPFGRIDDYDPASGLYYRAIDQQATRGGLLGGSKSGDNRTVNINIFDPATGKSTLLFNGSQPGDITVLAYETGYKDGTILFTGKEARVLNNNAIAERAPRDKLLIGVRNDPTGPLVIFVSDKRGGGLAKLAEVPRDASWHIDVRNSKLRVVQQIGQTLRIDSHAW